MYIACIERAPQFPLEKVTLEWHAAEETNECLESSCSAPAGGPCPVCGTSNGRKKLGAVGTCSGESQSVENASAKLKQNPIWKFFRGRNSWEVCFFCFLLFLLSRSSKICISDIGPFPLPFLQNFRFLMHKV